MKTNKPLTMFRLVMMGVVAIDSLKNLSTNALYGSQLLIYYVIAILVFFLPVALVSAELATTWPASGGIYVWVREAFGKRMAFMTVWLQWLVVVIWYPSVLSFIAAMLAYLYSPDLAVNQGFIFLMILGLFWGALLLVSRGLSLSSGVSVFCALVGVIIPMVLLIVLCGYWIFTGHPSQLAPVSHSLIAKDSLRLFITLLFSLMGIEVIAAHAGEVNDPEKNYAKALLTSAGILLALVIPSSFVIAVVLPKESVSLTTGVVDAFGLLLQAAHMTWMKPVLIIAMALGSFGIFLNWLLAAARYLLLAANEGALPGLLQKTNRHCMPVSQLVMQGIVFTVLSTAMMLMPSVNSAFWLLSAAAAQFALMYYVMLFMTALRLRYKHPSRHRPFRVGKKPAVLWLCCSISSVSCLVAFACGFFLPPELNRSHPLFYNALLASLMIVGLGTGGLIYGRWSYSAKSIIDTA